MTGMEETKARSSEPLEEDLTLDGLLGLVPGEAHCLEEEKDEVSGSTHTASALGTRLVAFPHECIQETCRQLHT
jgi:hypothetical protein